MNRDAIVGCLLGMAVGDSLGLPYEGLSPARASRLLGRPDRHRLLFGHGMVSDDTEHAIMVAQALCVASGCSDRFARELARRLRVWLLGLPAGVGRATLRAVVRLWLGFGPDRAGVYSAGNGPSMRAPVLGAAVDDLAILIDFVRASTLVTHRDPKALYGAIAVAVATRTAWVARSDPTAFLVELTQVLPPEANEFLRMVHAVVASARCGTETPQFAKELGLDKGVSGYTYHSVPVCLHAWLRYQGDFASSVEAVIRCGGDSDTTAAVVGGIVGAGTTKAGIPSKWLDGIADWPLSLPFLEKLGEALYNSLQGRPASRDVSRFPVLTRLPRNLLFLTIVLYHGFRRLLPPY